MLPRARSVNVDDGKLLGRVAKCILSMLVAPITVLRELTGLTDATRIRSSGIGGLARSRSQTLDAVLRTSTFLGYKVGQWSISTWLAILDSQLKAHQLSRNLKQTHFEVLDRSDNNGEHSIDSIQSIMHMVKTDDDLIFTFYIYALPPPLPNALRGQSTQGTCPSAQ